ncbi:MAG TPA: dethiobiotin synthase [Chitinophagales bacterium]|nr:dethiobiotin synthase [Chitinophagales bacterium]
MKVFITGIGTGVGKTVVSAILCEAFGADYWKPIQAGNLDESDTMVVRSLVTNPDSVFHPEVYRFRLAVSPHQAAADENKVIELSRFILKTANHLVIEGAGGVLVPLTQKLLMVDLMKFLEVPVILVSRHYLGSINHTLLSIEALRFHSVPLLGVIFNGNKDPFTEDVILEKGDVRFLGRVKNEPLVDNKMVSRYAKQFRQNLGDLFA